jgi:hypothetical protein
MSAVLETAEHQKISERADRYEKERAQWQRDCDSLQSSLKENANMTERLSEAEKRAKSLASEKWQLEHERLKILEENEAERLRLESAMAKQRLDYEKKIFDLEQAYERLKVNRDSISTSDETLVTERSMGNSLDIKGDAFIDVSLEIKSDAYGKYNDKGYEKADARTRISSSTLSSPHSDSQKSAAEEDGDHKVDLRKTMDEDRVARVLRQLALECDKHSNPSTPTATRDREKNATIERHEASLTHSAPPKSGRTDRPSSPPPAMSLRGAPKTSSKCLLASWELPASVLPWRVS